MRVASEPRTPTRAGMHVLFDIPVESFRSRFFAEKIGGFSFTQLFLKETIEKLFVSRTSSARSTHSDLRYSKIYQGNHETHADVDIN
jgi:hypothetical protein